VSSRVLEKLQSSNDAISDAVEGELRKVLASVNLSNPTAAREALFDAIPPLVERWGDVAATVAAEWFEEFRVVEGVSGSFTAQLADPVPLEMVNSRLGYATRESGHLFAGQEDDFGAFVSLMVNEYAMKPGHDTVMQNARRDKVPFARVPEPGACEWCLMLASRGFVYSRATVDQTEDGERYHGHCRCHAMPVYDETRARVIYGYDPERLYAEYRGDY
jgi:hypothetical protein